MTENPSFEEVLREWLRLKSRSLKASTAYSYRLIAERRIIPALGHLPVSEITVEILEDYIDNLHLVSTKNYHQIIQPTMDMARRHGLIPYNPCDDLCVRRRQRVPVKVYTTDEVRRLIAAATPQWKKDVIELAFRTGMRSGEIFALRWDDIDFDHGSITVQASCIYTPQQGVQRETPKTACATRCIDIDHHCVEILRKIPRVSAYVFAGTNGEPRYSATLEMSKICDKAGIPRRNLRHMRSTHISLLVTQGVPLTEIQQRVGHASPESLLRFYVQFAVGTQSASVEAFDQIDLGP